MIIAGLQAIFIWGMKSWRWMLKIVLIKISKPNKCRRSPLLFQSWILISPLRESTGERRPGIGRIDAWCWRMVLVLMVTTMTVRRDSSPAWSANDTCAHIHRGIIYWFENRSARFPEIYGILRSFSFSGVILLSIDWLIEMIDWSKWLIDFNYLRIEINLILFISWRGRRGSFILVIEDDCPS